MATYTTTHSFEFETPDPDEIPFDVIIRFKGSAEGKKAAAAELKKAKELLKKGAPYPKNYEVLEELSSPDGVLFTNVTRAFKKQGVPMKDLGPFIADLSASLKIAMGSDESITFQGAIFMPQSFMGSLRNVYFFSNEDLGPKKKQLLIEQYSASEMDDDKFDIEREIADWFAGRNPRRAELTSLDAGQDSDSSDNDDGRNTGGSGDDHADGIDAEPDSPTVDISMDFPTFLLTLLSGNWVFFEDNEIVWDGEHHQITGMQINSAQIAQFMPFVNTFASDFDDIEDVANHLIGFMTEIEKDDGLKVPRASIAPGVRKAIREGDLTGITLMNLAACGAAFSVRLMDGKYVVLFDTRLVRGIPAFFDLIARLIWDLRQGLHSLKGVPFDIAFVGSRNFDADQYMGDVRKAVIGAQSGPMAMKVEACPEVHFEVDPGTSKKEKARSRKKIDAVALSEEASATPMDDDDTSSCYIPFSSGFDEPSEMQADEELFETAVNSRMREFPFTVAIEGTHVLDRAKRIENVKVGDKLVLAADWQSPYFDPVCIEVFNEAGETLGNLNQVFSVAMAGNRELALLLPYVTATVESVTPLSKRRKNAKYALMDIKLDFDRSLLPKAWAEAYEKHVKGEDDDLWPSLTPWLSMSSDFIGKMVGLLARPKAQRVTMSRSTLSPSQLQGNIDTSEAIDNPYDLPKLKRPRSASRKGKIAKESVDTKESAAVDKASAAKKTPAEKKAEAGKSASTKKAPRASSTGKAPKPPAASKSKKKGSVKQPKKSDSGDAAQLRQAEEVLQEEKPKPAAPEDPRIKKMMDEEYDVKGRTDIIKAMKHQITAQAYEKLCETVAEDLIRRRRNDAENKVSESASFEQNAKATVRVFDEFNPIIIRYASYLLDVIDAQIDFGADLPTIMKMLLRVDRFFTLVTNIHCTNYKVIDKAAGVQEPFTAPTGYDDLHERVRAIETRYQIDSFPDSYVAIPSYLKGESTDLMSARIPEVLVKQAQDRVRKYGNVLSGNATKDDIKAWVSAVVIIAVIFLFCLTFCGR